MDKWHDYSESFTKPSAPQHPHHDASMETMELSAKIVKSWQKPPFQRPVQANKKILEVAEQIKKTGVIEGVITLGRISTEAATYYIVDGQHRLHAFLLSGVPTVFADVRRVAFDTMAEMAEEYVLLNTALVRMRPDDILRGLESSVPLLAVIRTECPFVSYDNVRRGPNSKFTVSMSATLRCWIGTATDTPTSMTGNHITVVAQRLDNEVDARALIGFLKAAHLAWGNDPESHRLWGVLNMCICMWLWRRLVIDRDRSGGKRTALLTPEIFKECLMEASADSNYVNWLVGRNSPDRDRSPCFNRLKAIFHRRLLIVFGGDKKRAVMPMPSWAAH